jgi:hypothetical protein
MVWLEEFPASYRVPKEIMRLVASGMIEDLSWRNDPAPSFGARLKDKNWIRLWVEHPNWERRGGFPTRYTVVVQPDLAVPFGRRLVATDDLGEALYWLTEVIRARGHQGRFRILEESGKEAGR